MTALHMQTDALKAALEQLRMGNFRVFPRLMLDELRLSLYELGQETVSFRKLHQLLGSINAFFASSQIEALGET